MRRFGVEIPSESRVEIAEHKRFKDTMVSRELFLNVENDLIIEVWRHNRPGLSYQWSRREIQDVVELVSRFPTHLPTVKRLCP